MQAVHHFSENYIEPVFNHDAVHFAIRVGEEVAKIVAAKIFLEYLGNRYLNDPKKVSMHDVHAATVLAPLSEEIIFRFIILKGISVTQEFFKDNHIQFGSTLYGPPELEEEGVSPVIIYPPLVDEMLCRGYITSIYLMSAAINAIFNRIYVTSSVCANESEQSGFAFQMSLPFELDVIYQTIKKGIALIDLPDEEELTEDEKVQQIFRIHLAALIFAAAHLANPHASKTSAMIQFSWSFIGGIIYGYLAEKYHSLAPGIIAHGFNNSITVGVQIYSHETTPYFFAALIANRVMMYCLAISSLDQIIVCGASQSARAFLSFPERVFNWKNEEKPGDEAVILPDAII